MTKDSIPSAESKESAEETCQCNHEPGEENVSYVTNKCYVCGKDAGTVKLPAADDDEGLIQDCTCGKCGTPQAEPTCSYTGHKHSHCDCGEERKKLEAENQRYKRVLEYLLYQSGHKDGNIGEAEMKLIEKTLQPPPPTNDE